MTVAWFLIYFAAFMVGGSIGFVVGRLLGFLVLHRKHGIPWKASFLFSGLRQNRYYDWLSEEHPDWYTW